MPLANKLLTDQIRNSLKLLLLKLLLKKNICMGFSHWQNAISFNKK